MAALIHEAALKFGTSGTLNEKELTFLWNAYDADKNGEKNRCGDRLRNFFSILEYGSLLLRIWVRTVHVLMVAIELMVHFGRIS